MLGQLMKILSKYLNLKILKLLLFVMNIVDWLYYSNNI